MTKTGYERVIGIDVSSKKLDISNSKGKLPAVIENTMESIESKLVKKIGASESCFVHGGFGSHEAQSGYRQVLPAVVTAWQAEKTGVDCLHAQTAADHSRHRTQWSDVGSTKQKGP